MDKSRIKKQVERFRKGFPWMNIVAPATPGRGISVLSDDEEKEAQDYAESHLSDVRGACKFVPASGAASRMFKDIFAGMATLEEGGDIPEAVYEAIYASSEFYSWRAGTTKRIILIGDAEPHPKPRGLGKYSKDYVMGLAEAKDIKVKAILLPSD